MPQARVDDIQMYYEVSGEGFPLVMVMGLGGNLDWWDPLAIKGYTKNFKTITFDNRETGRTEGSDRKYTIRLLADDAAGLMDVLGIPRAHVLGISMGGMIAQEMALNHPDKVEKLVLCSTSCGGEKAVKSSKETLATLMRIGTVPSAVEEAALILSVLLTKEFMDKDPGYGESLARRILKVPTSSAVFQRQLGAIKAFNTFDRLPGIKAPTLVVHGKCDVLMPPENGAILAKTITGARLVLLERSAHALAEDMKEATDAVTEFLLPPRSAT